MTYEETRIQEIAEAIKLVSFGTIDAIACRNEYSGTKAMELFRSTLAEFKNIMRHVPSSAWNYAMGNYFFEQYLSDMDEEALREKGGREAVIASIIEETPFPEWEEVIDDFCDPGCPDEDELPTAKHFYQIVNAAAPYLTEELALEVSPNLAGAFAAIEAGVPVEDIIG